MQEYRDGTFGEVENASDIFKKLEESTEEMNNTKCIHFGTEEELNRQKDISEIVKWYGETLCDVNNKLDKIIKHFKIYDIIGS